MGNQSEPTTGATAATRFVYVVVNGNGNVVSVAGDPQTAQKIIDRANAPHWKAEPWAVRDDA